MEDLRIELRLKNAIIHNLIVERFGSIAKQLHSDRGPGRERVRQLEQRALARLRWTVRLLRDH